MQGHRHRTQQIYRFAFANCCQETPMSTMRCVYSWSNMNAGWSQQGWPQRFLRSYWSQPVIHRIQAVHSIQQSSIRPPWPANPPGSCNQFCFTVRTHGHWMMDQVGGAGTCLLSREVMRHKTTINPLWSSNLRVRPRGVQKPISNACGPLPSFVRGWPNKTQEGAACCNTSHHSLPCRIHHKLIFPFWYVAET